MVKPAEPPERAARSLVLAEPPAPAEPRRAAIRALYRADETTCVERLLAEATFRPEAVERITRRAADLVTRVRAERRGAGGLDAFLQTYDLSSREGVVLMCLAEALLRIPDAETKDRLIRDKIALPDWERRLGASESLFVNASTWGLMLTGRIVSLTRDDRVEPLAWLGRMIARSGEPLIRQAMQQAMRILGRQFVLGRTIAEALERAAPAEERGWRHSYDMLGESARTMADADRYLAAYEAAIRAIGATARGADVFARPSISVKLSALHPRYEVSQADRVMGELVPRVRRLAELARDQGIGLTLDAEEAVRLDLSLDIVEAVSGARSLRDWNGFGLAVQAYQKRAPAVIDWLADLARRHRRRVPVRLVKGAYWDTEIKRSQEGGLPGYPVYTRKRSTDVAYIACAKRLFAAGEVFFPQLASHNAHTVSAVLEIAAGRTEFEFQRLHGMGEALYEQIVPGRPCRVYAPVGSHEDLLAYLVRRLLENGANTSFVNRIVDERLPVSDIVADPVAATAAIASKPHPRIPPPVDLYGPARRNARGLDLSDADTLASLAAGMAEALARPWRAEPVVSGRPMPGLARVVLDPSDRRRRVGEAVDTDPRAIEAALAASVGGSRAWDSVPAAERAAALERAADLLESRVETAMALIVREAGRTIPDALSEVREAVDFCRYYALQARTSFAEAEPLPGPTGERNQLRLGGRGPFVCISPWNFPLAIFTGQVAAALAAGNAVLAKPAEQTPLVAAFAVGLLHEAGIPGDALHLLPGGGEVGAALVADPRIAGVAFTGSTEVARAINRSLAARDGPIAALIAETGGQNAMIVDSSALPEQVVGDAVTSAFNSAGQRCSALRVMFVQRDVAPRVLELLAGAMAELRLGDPGLLATDVGPVIDAAAQESLETHKSAMRQQGWTIAESQAGPDTTHGTFVAPAAYEIDDIGVLRREVFGPILHVVRFEGDALDRVVDAINGTGYGLTLGIHSRIEETVNRILARARVGNVYVNRNMIGAVVGVQPFGGEGLSGTGPKAGGPHYLQRFAAERTVSVDTTAAGGNAALLSLEEGDV
jgi:RHH-type proline utilization regulon transcriptional repressor/proline dehydrogenase/delta 1-pyrroline-5-carboxylate dehydrogenase